MKDDREERKRGEGQRKRGRLGRGDEIRSAQHGTEESVDENKMDKERRGRRIFGLEAQNGRKKQTRGEKACDEFPPQCVCVYLVVAVNSPANMPTAACD